MARNPCDIRLLLVAAAVAFIYNQVRLFSTQSSNSHDAGRLAEAEKCESQLHAMIDQVSAQLDKIAALEEMKVRQDEERVHLKMLIQDLEKRSLQTLINKNVVNKLMAQGDTSSLRKALTDSMHSTIKNEIKRRESKWKSVHLELVEPAVSIKTLRARMIGLDKNDLDKAFIQLTLEFVTKQKFEAYNSKGEVVSGDKSKEVLVKDIWVFERSLFHPGAYWRVCGRITL